MNCWPSYAVFASSALLLPARERSALERESQGCEGVQWRTGALATGDEYSPAARAQIGLEAEAFRIELRNLKVKSLSSARIQ